jgi:PAS domain S-box-containing protein
LTPRETHSPAPAAAIDAMRLLAAMGEGVSLSDDKGIIVFANAAAERMFDCGPGELVGRRVVDLSTSPPDRTQQVLREIWIQLNTTGAWEGEWRRMHSDGTERITAVRVAPLETGGVTYWLTVQRDVTAARRAEEALAESEERLRLATEGSGMGSYDFDLAEASGIWSPQAFRLLGLEPTPDGICDAATWRARIHPDDRKEVQRRHAEAVRARAPWRLIYRIYRADNGRCRWLETYGRILVGRKGELRAVGMAIDVTARVEAEESLRESENRFQALANLAPAFVWFAGPDGAVRYLNDRWYAFTGQTPETALPDGWREVIHPEDSRRVGRAWARAILTGNRFEVECRYRHHSGDHRWFIVRAEPVRNERGEVEAWFGSSFDIHDLKQAESHQRLLIHELNHRVKNTLAIVQAIARQTFRQAGTSEARDAFEGRLAALSAAHDVLTRRNWETATIGQAVDSSLQALGRGADRVRVEGPDLLVPPKTAIALAMVIHELATNALKYGALSVPEGHVELGWASSRGRLRLSWRELDGPRVEIPQRRGFGTRLIEQGLAAELDGHVELRFEPAGVVCTVDAPLPTGWY